MNDATLRALADRVREYVDSAIAKAVAPLTKELGELRSRPVGLIYKGVYQREVAYAVHDGVTHAGSTWCALVDNPPGAPGAPDSGWQLCVKGTR